jgi:hypothetical protein
MNGDRPSGDPITMGIPTLVQHLRTLTAQNSDLDLPMVERVTHEFTFYKPPFSSNQAMYAALLRALVAALPVLQADEAIRAVASLTETLLQQMPVQAITSLATDELLLTALGAPHPSANVLGLEILRRFEKDQVGEEFDPDVFLALLRCWLGKPEVEVGARAQQAIVNLLARERELDGRLGARIGVQVGATTRRISPMTRLPDPTKHQLWGSLLLGGGRNMVVKACLRSTEVSYRQTSLSQIRLLGLLPELAELDFEALFAATAPAREGEPAEARRLLWWASSAMVDREDEAMVLAMVEFYKAMVRGVYESGRGEDGGGPTAWFEPYVGKLQELGRPEVERAARELANEAGMAVAKGEEGAVEFGEWLEEVWN